MIDASTIEKTPMGRLALVPADYDDVCRYVTKILFGKEQIKLELNEKKRQQYVSVMLELSSHIFKNYGSDGYQDYVPLKQQFIRALQDLAIR